MSEIIQCTELFPGHFTKIQVVAVGTRTHALQIIEFLDTLTKKEVERLEAIFFSIDDFYPLHYPNQNKFKNFSGSLYEIKEGQIRLGCFQKGPVWVLIYGFRKKDGPWPQKHRNNLFRLYRKYKDTVCRIQ